MERTGAYESCVVCTKFLAEFPTSGISGRRTYEVLRFVSLAALLVSVLMSMPQSFAQSKVAIETARPMGLTVAPAVPSPISMTTVPQAVCVLHAENADRDGSLTLFADRSLSGPCSGGIRSSGALFGRLRCRGGKVSRFPLQLRANSCPTSDMPAPPAEVKSSRPGAFVRPALSNEDALYLSPEELARRGYPPRPDPEPRRRSQVAGFRI
jgi:hypothetical protein